MSSTSSAKTAAYWQHIEGVATSKVIVAIRWSEDGRQPVIAYLRDLETAARKECDRRQTIQIIASGRRLLGDRGNVGPVDGPFAHTLGAGL